VEPLARHLLSQAFNNAWANHRLLGACAQLNPPEFEAPRTGFFGSIKATLNHALTVDWYYIDAIERGLASQAPNGAFMAFYTPEEPFADCAALWAAQRASDRRLIALCEPLDAAALATIIVVPRRAGLTHEPLPRLLAHLFQHQVHHRGQVALLLRALGQVPGNVDLLFYDSEQRAVRQ